VYISYSKVKKLYSHKITANEISTILPCFFAGIRPTSSDFFRTDSANIQSVGGTCSHIMGGGIAVKKYWA
jgi:hypothetical protein